VITGRVTDADSKPLIEERITLTPVDDKGEPVRGLAARPANFLMTTPTTAASIAFTDWQRLVTK